MKCTQEKAVIDLCVRNGFAKKVVETYGVSRMVLYQWKRQLLRTGGSKTMLNDAIQTLNPEEHHIDHSNRGGHCHWSGWIERMEKTRLIRSKLLTE